MLAAATYAFGTVRDLEDWFYDGVVLGCVVLAAWRGAAVREDRAAWLLIALGLGAGSPATSGG